jgi:ribosomal protein L37AE/L43A
MPRPNNNLQRFHCPSCSRRLKAPASAAGRWAKCPQCGTLVQVPRAAPMTDADIADLLSIDDDDTPPPPPKEEPL